MNQPTPIKPETTVEWLNKLIMLAQLDKKLPFYAVRVSTDPAARQKLLEAVARVPALREMFATDPFAGAPAEHLQLLAEVSDITTDPQKMVASRNGTFLAVIEALRQSPELDTELLMVDGLSKYFNLIATNEVVAQMLFELATSPHWYVVLASLRDERDYVRDEEPAVAETLKAWQAKLTTDLRARLFKPGHLSRAPRKLIQMAWNHRELFEEARDSRPPDAREKDPFEERRQVANLALSLFESKFPQECEAIKAELMVLATVARHYINVRKFAKLDGFVYTWPEIARMAMGNYSALRYVEDLLVNRKPRPPETELDARDARDLYALCEKNDRLIRFFRLKPYFSEINEDELRRYRPLAPVVVEAAETSVSDSGRAVDDMPPQPSPPQTIAKHPSVRYLNIEEAADLTTPEEEPTYRVWLSPENVHKPITQVESITLSVKNLLARVVGALGVTSDGALQELLKELFSSSARVAESRMMRGGLSILEQLLPEVVQGGVLELLSRRLPLRLILRLSENLHYLPWEWFPDFSSTELLMLSSPHYSLVRGTPHDEKAVPVALIAPLRILSIIPDPPPGQRFTSDITIKGLEDLTASEGARYKALIRSEATVANIERELESFNPHVVHFEGYVNQPTADGELTIAFSKPNPAFRIDAFGETLRDRGVQLLVIGRNSASHIYENVGARAAVLLAQQGLPAIIAPLRGIDETSATTFTTEFYRAFLQGNTLESSLHLARRSLASKGGDWSVFALFADPDRLDNFQLLRESA